MGAPSRLLAFCAVLSFSASVHAQDEAAAWPATFAACPAWYEYLVLANCADGSACDRIPSVPEFEAICAEFRDPNGGCGSDPNAVTQWGDDSETACYVDDCLTCHNQCNCDSMDAMDASCQSCHSACDDGTDCQVEGCGDGKVPDGSGGCCYATIEDVPEDEVAQQQAVATACATQLAACEGAASFLELGPEVCGTETPACVAIIDTCEDSGADCAAAEGCEEVESDMGTWCAPTAGIARDIVDCYRTTMIALLGATSTGTTTGTGTGDMCADCHSACDCPCNDQQGCGDQTCQDCHHACDGLAFCSSSSNTDSSGGDQSGGDHVHDEMHEPPTCNFAALMGALAGAMSANDLSRLEADPIYVSCASVAAAIGEMQIAASCGGGGGGGEHEHEPEHEPEGFDCASDPSCTEHVDTACRTQIMACLYPDSVGEFQSYATIGAVLETAAQGSCMAGIGACLTADDEASCTAASCSWIAPVITSESCTANDDAATPPTNCEFTAGDGSTCGAGCSYSHSVSGGGCAPADGPGAALFTCVTTAEREFGTTTPPGGNTGR